MTLDRLIICAFIGVMCASVPRWFNKWCKNRIARKKYMENKELIDGLLEQMAEKAEECKNMVDELKDNFDAGTFSNKKGDIYWKYSSMFEIADSIRAILGKDRF